MTTIEPLEPEASPVAVRRSGVASRPLTDAVLAIGVEVVLGWCGVVVGVVMILVGYLRVDAADSLAQQFAYFSSACIGGLALIGLGGLCVLSRQHADAQRAVQEIRRRHAGGQPRPASSVAGPTRPSGAALVVAAGTATYHRRDCVFVAGRRDLRSASPGDGLRPCQVCHPEA